MRSLVLRIASSSSLSVHPLSLELFGQLPADEFADLKADIASRGLQYPLEVDAHQRIICGSQRFRAVCELGWTEVGVLDRADLAEEDQIREHLIRDNLFRRHLSRLQRFHAARVLAEIESAKAAERQKALGRSHGRREESEQTGEAVEIAARQVGMSRETFRQLGKVVDSGDGELLARVDRNEISVKEAYRQVVIPRHRARPADEDQIVGLRIARWQHQVERLLQFVESHPPSLYHPLEAEIYEELGKARERIGALLVRGGGPGGGNRSA